MLYQYPKLTIEEIEKTCLKMEKAYQDEHLLSEPAIIVVAPRNNNLTATKTKIFDDFYADILINGKNIPTIAIIKCRDFRRYLRKIRGDPDPVPQESKNLIKKFYKRNKPE